MKEGSDDDDLSIPAGSGDAGEDSFLDDQDM